LRNTSLILTFVSQIARLYQPLGTEYLESDDEAEGDSYEANDLLPRHAHATDPRPDSDPWSDAPPLLPSRDQADGVYANNGAQGGPPKTTARRSSLENVWDDREDLFSVGNVPSVPIVPAVPVVPSLAPAIPAPIAAAASIPPVTQTAPKSAAPAILGSGTAVAATSAVATGAELFDVGGDDDDDEDDDEEEDEEESGEEDEDDEDEDDEEEEDDEDDDEEEEEEEAIPARRPPAQN
jgi:hypothetical protein